MQMAEKEEVLEIASPENAKSAVWKNFGHPVYVRQGVRHIDKKQTICKLCKTVLNHSGNTTNMRTHIARHHAPSMVPQPLVVKNEKHEPVPKPHNTPKYQPSISKLFQKQAKYPATSERAQLITKLVATYIVSDMRPLSIVENKQFIKMLEMTEPRYNLPCRKYFTEKVIPEMFEETKNCVGEKLKAAKSVSITTDSWTSRATDSYMTVTAHHINENWDKCNHVLTTRKILVAHTGQNLGNALTEVLGEWNLDIPAGIPIVSDNASNMEIAAKTASLTPHIKCFAHTINLASQRGLKVNSMARLLGRIRRVVTFFHKSTTATSTLASKQQLLGVPKHKLVSDVATRWNSSYDIIERFLEQQPAILSALTSNDVKRNAKYIATLTDEDMNDSERAVEILKPLKVATTIMCEEHDPTVSLIFPLKMQIIGSMNPNESDNNLAKEVKAAVSEDLRKRYTVPEVEDFLLMATALDPRFHSLPQISTERRDEVFNNIHMKAVCYSEQQNVKAEQQRTEGGETLTKTGANGKGIPLPQLPNLVNLPAMSDLQDEELECPPPKQPAVDIVSNKAKPGSALESFFGEVFIVAETLGIALAERINSEIREYRLQPNILVTENPLHWWKLNSSKFPLLSKVARSVLCIPGTSVPSERVFSTAGDIVTATRSCLDPDLVDKLIFLKKNMNF